MEEATATRTQKGLSEKKGKLSERGLRVAKGIIKQGGAQYC